MMRRDTGEKRDRWEERAEKRKREICKSAIVAILSGLFFFNFNKLCEILFSFFFHEVCF